MVSLPENSYIPFPFAKNAELSQSLLSNCENGIGSNYATPIQNGGSYFTRKIANTLGFIVTFSLFADTLGIPNEYNNNIGYSIYSIIDYIDGLHCLKKLKANINNPSSPDVNLNNWSAVMSTQIINYNPTERAISDILSNGW
jgi:hypothetical protein